MILIQCLGISHLQVSSLLLVLNTFFHLVNCLSIDQSHATKLQAIQETEKSSHLYKVASDSLADPLKLSSEHQQPVDHRRPIWVLAHMVNSIKELEYRLAKGANAVEVDVTFGRNGDPLYTYHGPPCDCWRHCNQQEDFNDYLSYVRELTIDEQDGVGKNLTILFLDLKLDYLNFREKARAGTELAKSILNNLYVDLPNPPPKNTLKLILSVNHVGDIELVRNFLHTIEKQNSTQLLSLIGFDVGMNDDIQLIESMWSRLNGQINLWQGDGYTNCISPFYNLKRLTKALQKRDSQTGYPSKVYHWTIDIHDRIRESLRLGVDALMTNHPERALKVLTEPDIVQNFRLATREDDPFKKIIRTGKSSESARYQRSAHPINDGFFGNIMDVIASWYNYIREIPIFSFPTTSRLFKMKKPSKKSTPQMAYKTVASNSTESSFVTLSRSDQNTISTSQNTTDALNATDVKSKDSGFTSSSETIGQTQAGSSSQLENGSNEGPKWYISLASNLLVSFMKILLPADT